MSRHTQITIGLVSILFAILNGNAIADDDSPEISWSTGLEFSSGTYGGLEDIEDTYIPVKARVDFDRMSFSLTVPYLSVRGPASTILIEPGGEPVPGSGEIVTESGLGDVVAGLTIYDVAYSSDLGLALDLSGRVKFGTADETKGLGTGEQDFTIRADLYKYLGEFTLLGSAGYKFRGDPEGVDLENVFLGSVGSIYLPNDTTALALIYDYRESALPGGDAVEELTASVYRQFGNTWAVEFYTFTGFSDSAADWGAGIQLSLDWNPGARW